MFYYPPWNTNCVFTWYSAVDFTLIPIKTDKSTSNIDSCLKTENGDGIKLLTMSETGITVLWDRHTYREIYISDEDTIAIIHNNDHYYFNRV